MFQTNAVEKIKTQFLSNNFFPPRFRAVNEIVCKSIVERGMP